MADIKILDLTEATEITETTDYIPVVDTSDTTQDSTGTTKKATVRKLLGDRVLPDTIVGTTETQTLTDKTLSTGSVIDANVNVIEVLKKAYPIGSVYINASNSTNPASLLGFGTWVAFGAGKVMVGLDAGDTSFDTLGETGGAKTNDIDHDHNLSNNGIARFAMGANTAYTHSTATSGAGGNWNATWGISATRSANTTGIAEGATLQGATDTTSSFNAVNNLQPYIVVYRYRRTA